MASKEDPKWAELHFETELMRAYTDKRLEEELKSWEDPKTETEYRRKLNGH